MISEDPNETALQHFLVVTGCLVAYVVFVVMLFWAVLILPSDIAGWLR